MNQPDFGKVASAVGVAAGLLAVGAAAGVVAERAVVAKAGRADREADEPFGHLRGTPVRVTDSNGVALHAEIEPCTRDNPENLTIVFCHGYALNEDCWHYQRRDLRALGRPRVLGPAQPRPLQPVGRRDQHDRAAGPWTSRPSWTRWFPTGPIVLVGHSMGGMTIMQLALDHPELFGTRIRGVALLSTSPGGPARRLARASRRSPPGPCTGCCR